MNKAEMVRKYTRQTVEQERNLEKERKQDLQRVFQSLESLTQNSGSIIQHQEAFTKYLQYHSGLIIQTKEENSNLIKEMKALRKDQKRIQVIWIINFLMIAVPISAFWVGWLVYWMLQ